MILKQEVKVDQFKMSTSKSKSASSEKSSCDAHQHVGFQQFTKKGTFKVLTPKRDEVDAYNNLEVVYQNQNRRDTKVNIEAARLKREMKNRSKFHGPCSSSSSCESKSKSRSRSEKTREKQEMAEKERIRAKGASLLEKMLIKDGQGVPLYQPL